MMTKKLRYKFIAFSTSAVALLLLLILGIINITNFSCVAASSDNVTLTLASKGGQFDDKLEPGAGSGAAPGSQNPGEGEEGPNRPDAPDSPDMQQSMRYFTVSFDASGIATMANQRLSFFDEATAIGYATEVHAKGYGVGWYAQYYRYRSYIYNGVDYVSFIDASRELTPSYNVLYASLFGGLSGILVTFLVLIPLSKLLVKPTEEAWRKQKRFVSDASHELKTPLSIISANNELNELALGESEYSKAIAKQVKALNHLVKNLNALAKLDEESTLPMGDIELSQLVEEVASGFAYKYKDGAKSFALNVEEGLTMKGNETAIRSLYQTIIDNAFKYSVSKISLNLKKEGDRIVTLISNDSNIPADDDGPLDRIFERFYRRDEDRASSIEGSGIGLSLAKEVVTLHKGRIFAWAEKGTFFLKIEF